MRNQSPGDIAINTLGERVEPFLDIDIDEDGGSESCRYPAAMTAEGVFSCCRDK